MTRAFLAATDGHTTVMNFSTIPAWLFKTDKPVTYPDDPDTPVWNYTQGTELRDSTGAELGAYYARLVSWYVDGGFTDENGVRHESGYHYKLPIWEVLNEVDFEHAMTPEQYTARYDAIVSAIHKASPSTQFMGLALAAPSANPHWFEFFLESREPQAGDSARLHLLPLLRHADSGGDAGDLAVHLLCPGRRVPEHRAIRRGDPEASFARDEDGPERAGRDPAEGQLPRR